MNDVIELSDWMKQDTARFSTRKKMFVFKELVYTATGEKVIEGFRYFTCPVEQVIQAVESLQIGALTALPYALDEDGDADTSGVCVLLAYTESCAFVALQPQQYQDFVPTALRPPCILEGDAARAAKSLVVQLDQTS